MGHARRSVEPVWMRAAYCQEIPGASEIMPKRAVVRTAEETAYGQVICGACKVRVDCLNYAIKNYKTEGIWGGFTEKEVRQIRWEGLTPGQAVQASLEAAVLVRLTVAPDSDSLHQPALTATNPQVAA